MIVLHVLVKMVVFAPIYSAAIAAHVHQDILVGHASTKSIGAKSTLTPIIPMAIPVSMVSASRGRIHFNVIATLDGRGLFAMSKLTVMRILA